MLFDSDRFRRRTFRLFSLEWRFFVPQSSPVRRSLICLTITSMPTVKVNYKDDFITHEHIIFKSICYIAELEILHICNLWILLRKIVIYLCQHSAEHFIFGDFRALKVDGYVNPGTCLIAPGCFNIQTNHGFENLVPIQFRVNSCVFSL